MKRILNKVVSTSVASVFTLGLLAQDSPTPKPTDLGYVREVPMNPVRADQLNGAAKASDLIGTTVHNYQNEKLGKIEDLAVDVESGRVVQVIVSSGGFLGIGDSLTAVPPGALHHDVANKVIHLDANKEKFNRAPRFDGSRWVDGSDSNHLSMVYVYFGQEPAFRFIHEGDLVPEPVRETNGTWEQNRVARERKWMIPASRLSHIQSAKKLMGLPVKNLQSDSLGKVENVLVDLSAGRIVAVVISSGGFLGMGDELSAVPAIALKFNADRDTLELDATKEMLSNAPHFRSNQWPEFQPTYADGIYRAYKLEPYFTTNTVSSSDLSTTRDQGTEKGDVDLTAMIRKGVVDSKQTSVNGKKVSIVTNKGQVTLRGPVNTAEEKRVIGEIANGIARAGNVDNQLEVRLTTSSNN